MKKQMRGMGIYTAIIIAFLVIFFLVSAISGQDKNYRYQDFLADAEAGQVKEVTITPNKEIPTGVLVIQYADEKKMLYVTDIDKVQADLEKLDIDPIIEDVDRDSVFLTTIYRYGQKGDV